MQKIVYSIDSAGYLIGPVTLDEGDLSPLEPDVFLIPGNCVELIPPQLGEREVARWTSEGWTVEALPAEPVEPGADPQPESASRRMTSLEFLDLFSEAEQLAVITAAMSSPQINLWWTKLTMATYVDFEDPRLAAGLQALVDAGLLTAERAQEVLA